MILLSKYLDKCLWTGIHNCMPQGSVVVANDGPLYAFYRSFGFDVAAGYGRWRRFVFRHTARFEP